MHPPRQSKSPIFEEIGEIWTVGEVIRAVLAFLRVPLRATTKKGRQLLGGGRKVHPQTKSWLRPCFQFLHGHRDAAWLANR